MTTEQWLVYLYGIWPEGGPTTFYTVWAVLAAVFLIVMLVNIFIVYNDDPDSIYHFSKSLFFKYKGYITVFTATPLVLIVLSSLVPDKRTMLYIIATPYAVESGKTLIESLNDETSKLYKLNQLLDASLDKALEHLKD